MTATTSEVIDQDRRRLFGVAAMGIAAIGAASLFPTRLPEKETVSDFSSG